MVESAAGAPFLNGASLPAHTAGPALLRRLLDRAAASGLTFMRAWAHTVSDEFALQTAPGVYNEAVLRGLDYALQQARERGIRVRRGRAQPHLCAWAKGRGLNVSELAAALLPGLLTLPPTHLIRSSSPSRPPGRPAAACQR